MRSSCSFVPGSDALRSNRCIENVPYRRHHVNVSSRLRKQATELCIRSVLWRGEPSRNDFFLVPLTLPSMRFIRDVLIRILLHLSPRIPSVSMRRFHRRITCVRSCVPIGRILGFDTRHATPCVVKSTVHNPWSMGRGEDSPTLPTVDVEFERGRMAWMEAAAHACTRCVVDARRACATLRWKVDGWTANTCCKQGVRCRDGGCTYPHAIR